MIDERRGAWHGFGAHQPAGQVPVPEPIRLHVARRAVVRFAAAVLAFVGLFALLGRAVVSWSALDRWDLSVNEWFVRRRTPRLDDLSLIGSTLAETWVKIGVTAIVAVWCWWRWRRLFEATFLALALVFEALVFILVTWIVQRPRPDVPRLDGSPVDSSFPSGHTAAAAVYVTFAILIAWHCRRRWVAWLALVVVALVVAAVALARVYRGMHHPSDVIAGAILGIASVAFVGPFVIGLTRRTEDSS